MATGIKDKPVILGIGCSKFGERWDCNAQHLMVETFEEALADAGIEHKQIDAASLGAAKFRIQDADAMRGFVRCFWKAMPA